MQRRDFLKYGGAGVLSLGAGGAALSGLGQLGAAQAQVVPASGTVRLFVRDVEVELVDGVRTPMLAFVEPADFATRNPLELVPGPVIRVKEGDVVTIELTNQTNQPHSFLIHGLPGSAIAPVLPNETRQVTIAVPSGRCGSYLYLDPSNAPVNRILGLHGAFIIEPAAGNGTTGTSVNNPTPYARSQLNASLAAMFDAFGRHARFPGNSWVPEPPAVPSFVSGIRQFEKIWICNDIDDRFNLIAQARGSADPGLALDLVKRWEPRYFTINGRSGFFAHGREAPDIWATNYIGEPTLIRNLNAGLCTHSMHIHGNHCFELSTVVLPSADDPAARESTAFSGAFGSITLLDNILERDVWPLVPLDRRDLILPYEVPPDIPVFPPVVEPFPIRYVMHDHIEMATTAAGGNYPQGLVSGWEIAGPLGGRRRLASL